MVCHKIGATALALYVILMLPYVEQLVLSPRDGFTLAPNDDVSSQGVVKIEYDISRSSWVKRSALSTSTCFSTV